jgi:hypothetical protein
MKFNPIHFCFILVVSIHFIFGQKLSEVKQELKPLGTMPKNKHPQIYMGTTFLVTLSTFLITIGEAEKGGKQSTPIYFQWYLETPQLGGFIGYKGSYFNLPATVRDFNSVISTELFYKHFTTTKEEFSGWFLQYSAVLRRLQSNFESKEEPYPIESNFGWSGGAMIYLGYEDKSHKKFWWGLDLGVGGVYSSKEDLFGIPYKCPTNGKNCHHILVSPNIKVGISF